MEILSALLVTCVRRGEAGRARLRQGDPAQAVVRGLAHAPFNRVHGRIVGFSCGHGSGAGDLRARSHAFLGTIAK